MSDITNYARISAALVEVCRDALWEILVSEVPAKDLPKKIQALPKRLLSAEQKSKLCPTSGSPSASDVDISVLYTLIRNLCDPKYEPSNSWGKPPGKNDTQVGDDVERIRQMRNVLQGHPSKYALSSPMFKQHWAELTSIVRRLDAVFGKRFKDDLDVWATKCMDEKLRKVYEKKIQALKDNYEDLEQAIDKNKQAIEENRKQHEATKQVAVESKQAAEESKQVAAESKQVAVESKEAAMESKQVAMESKQVAVESKQAAEESKQAAMESKQMAAESKQVAVESKQAAVESKQVAEESKQAAEESKQVAVESKQAAMDSKQMVAESKQVAVESKQAAEESKQVAMESKKAAEESKQVAVESKQAAEESKQVAVESKQAAVESKQAAEESKQAAEESKQAAVESKQAAVESKQVAEESKQVAVESKQAAEESKQVAVESKQAAVESKQVAEESKQAAEESKQAAVESKQAAVESKQVAEESKQVAVESKQVAEESKQVAVESKEGHQKLKAEVQLISADHRKLATDVQGLQSQLESQEKLKTKFKEELRGLQAAVDGNKDQTLETVLEQTVDENKQDIEENKQAIEENKQDIEENKQDIEENKQAIEENKQDIEEHRKQNEATKQLAMETKQFAKEGQQKLEAEVQLVSSDQGKMATHVQGLQRTFEGVSESQKKLKTQVKEDIQGLQRTFEGVSESQKKLKTQVKEDIQGLQSKFEGVSESQEKLKIKVQEDVQGLQSKFEGVSESQEKLKTEIHRDISEIKEELGEQQAAAHGSKSRIRKKDFKELQKKLIELYQDKSFSEVQVSPLDEITIPIDKIYTELVIVEETVDKTMGGEMKRTEKELSSYTDLFYKNKKRQNNVAILASAGKGKTTFCHQLAHLWCKVHRGKKFFHSLIHFVGKGRGDEADAREESLRQFEYLFLIHLRLVNGPISIFNAICSTLLKEYNHLYRTVKEVFIQHPDKVLVICDGLDEYHAEVPPSRVGLGGCTVLTTTRPWKYEYMRTSSDKPDIVLQLKGLNDEGVKELTERMMLHYNEKECKKECKAKARQCMQEIRKAKLVKTAQIPLILTHLVYLWYSTQKQLSESVTVNLTKLILHIVQKGEEKIKGDPQLKEIPKTWSKELPGVLHNELKLERNGDLLLCLAKLAFEGLISKNKEESLVFRDETLDKYFNDPLKKEACLKYGLLSESKVSYEGTIATAVSFYHKLVQEFFSAIHAVCSKENCQELCNYCNSIDKIMDMENVYIFISGLNPEIGSQFSKHVAEVMSEDSGVTDWRKKGLYTMVQLTNLNASCVQEMEHSSCSTDHVFYITDICVIGKTPRKLECLLRHATQTVVYVHVQYVDLTKTEWEQLLHVVSESPSLQTLKLKYIKIGDQDVGDNVAVYDVNTNTSSHSALQHVVLYDVPAPLLLPLLTLVRSTTTVTQQDNSGSDGDCTAGLTSVTTGTLTDLKLWDVTMTRCELDMLVNIVSESPSLQTLELAHISIGGQDVGDNVAVYDVNTNTSSHSALQHVELWYVSAPLLLPLLTLVRSRTTVTQQDNSGSDGDCTAGLTSVTTGTLTYLRLWHVTMTRCEWNMLVNIVSESPSLQTLRLGVISIGGQDVGDNVAVYDVNTNTSSHSALQHVELQYVSAPLLLPLLTLVRSRTTVTQQDNSGSDGDCTAGLTSVTTGTLTYLRLWHVTMTRCEWNMLVNIVSESPSLQTLRLGVISIGGQDVGDNVAVYDVNTNTSSHSALQHVELQYVSAPLLLPLLTLVRSRTTVTQQDNSGSDGDCTAGLTSVTTGTLAHLKLCNVTMTRCEWKMLVNIVSESPSLQTLKLESVTMTRCEWKMLVNIVSESPSLQTLMLRDITIDGNKKNTDCWRQMCDLLHSSLSLTEIVLVVHKAIGNMKVWKIFTPDRWKRSSGPWWCDKNLMEIVLNKIN